MGPFDGVPTVSAKGVSFRTPHRYMIIIVGQEMSLLFYMVVMKLNRLGTVLKDTTKEPSWLLSVLRR